MLSSTKTCGWLALAALGSLVAWRFAGGAARGGVNALAPAPTIVAAPRTDTPVELAPHEAGAHVAERVVDPVPATPHRDAPPPLRSTALVEERRAIPAPTPQFVVHGRVWDERAGAPLADWTVHCGPWSADGSEPPEEEARSDARGEFSFVVAESAGGWFVELLPPEEWVVREPRRRVSVERARAGESVEFLAKVWPPRERGEVRGRLLAESGAFAADVLAERNAILLEMSSLEEPPLTARAALTLVEGANGANWIEFALEDVPVTEYALTIVSLDGCRWEPSAQVVVPPAQGLEFVRYDAEERLPLRFRVLDDATDEPIAEYRARIVRATPSEDQGVFLHTGPLDEQDPPRDATFAWTIDAPGFAPAFGDESAFTPEGEERVAEVRLRRGWATRFLVMGGAPRTRLLAGAEIRLDGERVGWSDRAGALVVELPQTPETIEVRYLDWELANEPLGRTRGRDAESRGNTTIVLLREPRE